MIPPTLLDLDVVSAVGLLAVAFILVIGLCRRFHSRRRRILEAAVVSNTASAVSAPRSDAAAATSVPLIRPTSAVRRRSPCASAELLVQSAAESASSDDGSGAGLRRRLRGNGGDRRDEEEMTDSAEAASVPPSSKTYLCSDCQCSMQQCRCTIVLYRPNPTADLTVTSSSLRQNGSIGSTTKSTTTTAPEVVNGLSSVDDARCRALPVGRLTVTCPAPPSVVGRRSPVQQQQNGRPKPDVDATDSGRYLSVPAGGRVSSASGRRLDFPTSGLSSTSTAAVEVNANVINCKNKMLS